MAINFDELPDNAMPEAGQYLAQIKSAKMKVSQSSGNEYMNLELALFKDNKAKGTIYDIITESDSDLQKFKLKRLIEACKLPIHGMFELKDLSKLLPGKAVLVDVTQEKADPEKGRRERAAVDVFSAKIYYPAPEEGVKGSVTTPTKDDLPAGFNEPDADDSKTVQHGSEDY